MLVKNFKKKNAPSQTGDSDIEVKSDDVLQTVRQTEDDIGELFVELSQTDDPEAYEPVVDAKLASLRNASMSLGKAYYQTRSIHDELAARYIDVTKAKKSRFILRSPANSTIDFEERRIDHFAKGINGYKLLLIGYIGSFVGVIVETLWCILRWGTLESRAGLMYGPFNLLYGVGAVAMTVALYGFRNKGKWLSFMGGFLIGSVLEYFCSWIQETLIGSTSWDYSGLPFNINGRVCLLYSLFWGLLGVLWVKTLYPLSSKLILKLKRSPGVILTWLMLAFFIVNSLVTAIAVFRWSQRMEMVEASNAFWEFIDLRFPDNRMESVFANMRFK